MSLALKILQESLENRSTYSTERASLDLPQIENFLALSPRQQEGLDLAISNSPIALIAGCPGSGKTRLGYLALIAAIQAQRSTLLASYNLSTLKSYQSLPLRPLIISKEADYLEGLSVWLRQQLAQPKLDFTPTYLFSDPFLIRLQENPSFSRYLDLAESNQEKRLEQEFQALFPELNTVRLKLLVYRFQKSLPLLEQKNLLLNHYRSLSDQGILQLAENIKLTSKVPILGVLRNILKTELVFSSFDLVIVEDCHYLSKDEILSVARIAKKLVLLGEVENNSYFSRLFESVFPGYRLKLSEHFRINSRLARLIFSHLFKEDPYFRQQSYRPLDNRLLWFDIQDSALRDKIFQFISEQSSDYSFGIIVFSSDRKQQLQKELSGLSDYHIKIDLVENWMGCECEILLVICDEDCPTKKQLRLAFTRAKEMIVCFGSYDYHKHYRDTPFSPLFRSESFKVIREVNL